MRKVLILLLCSLYYCAVSGSQLRCTNHRASLYLKKSTYDFSVRLVDRVAQETKGHFVFSPLSTWIQLMALAEGARGRTLNEILRVTRYPRLQCFRKKIRYTLNSIEDELKDMAKFQSHLIIEELLDVKKSYRKRVENNYAVKFVAVDFKDNFKSAAKVNEIVEADMDGVITEAVHAGDFIMTMLLMSDTAYMKADWRYPFNPVLTSTETFYSEDNVPIGEVRMMHQTGYFNETYIPFIRARALELPFNDRITMIVLLPTRGSAMDLYFSMKNINLMTIFSLFKTKINKLVTVKMPRFNITTDLDNIPELVHDMGVHRIFYPQLADFKDITNFKIHASMMTQTTYIEVTERGVSARNVPEYLMHSKRATHFTLNKPFAYLIVDKKTNIPLFAGIYSRPKMY